MGVTRRNLIKSAAAMTLAPIFKVSAAKANDLPSSLKNVKDQFYNFLLTFAQGQGMSGSQRIVLNSLILPFDIAPDTPYHNEEIFRQYADRTFHGGTESVTGSTPASQAERFSSQYRAVTNIAALQIDQHHPEIRQKIADLRVEQTKATNAFTDKITYLENQWAKVVASRGLKKGTLDYDLQRVTWQAQIRYGDQIATLSADIDRVDSEIDAVRRRVYTPAQAAVIDNIALLGSTYNVARPWTAQTERAQKQAGAPLTDIILADVNKLAPAIFDSAPLVFPVGDLTAFLSAPNGNFGFDTGHQSFTLDQGTSSWAASGGGSFFGWSLGGGGSGSSSYSHSMSLLNSISLSFANMAEYVTDRSAWFNPGVLQDKEIMKLVKTRPELNNLQYIAVSLILVRGTNLQLKFSQAANASDFSQSSWNAHGGGSFMGFGFGVAGGGSSSRYTINNSADWTTVTFQDDASVARVVGVRVEPFLVFQNPLNATISSLAAKNSQLNDVFADFKSGKIGYIELQKAKVETLMRSRVQ
jgi:hypothetical protein